MNPEKFRKYHIDTSIVFWKTTEKWGELSNMASGFPLFINDYLIPSSEALYQACRFPDYPEIQKMVIGQSNAMYAKRVAQQNESYTRKDWYQYRVLIMKWCLRLKLLQHWSVFSRILLATKDLPIVEFSKTDTFWGACPMGKDILIGENVLGRLLMEIRERIKSNSELAGFKTPNIPNFKLFNAPIQEIILKNNKP
ncbi:NADAR family protein [Kingella oralis]|jgi:type I restriction-modification system specificity subunit|uniref:NADAR family protein n=1 Tax=Kingella oralis TaxID=505 RepID=UPI0034E38268